MPASTTLPLKGNGADNLTKLLHEVWIVIDEEGQELEGCCLAGPHGDGFRKLLKPKARLVNKFTAISYFEAMNIY
jgi:hypothetical protein